MVSWEIETEKKGKTKLTWHRIDVKWRNHVSTGLETVKELMCSYFNSAIRENPNLIGLLNKTTLSVAISTSCSSQERFLHQPLPRGKLL